MKPNEYPPKFSAININDLSKEFKSSTVGKKLMVIMEKPKKKIKNQDIIDFRYWLINQMYPGSVPENSSTSFIAGERRVGQDAYEKAVFEEVLMQFNNHFGTRGYDIG